MPIVEKRVLEDGSSLGIWRVEEPLDTLKKGLDFSASEWALFEGFTHDARKLEWMAARQLLKAMEGRPLPLQYNDLGKPSPVDGSLQLSLSHSHGWVAATTHPNQPRGLDIQLIRPKIARIRNKFLNPAEKTFCSEADLELLHVIWGAKESIFKWFGMGGLDFRYQMEIEPFTMADQGIIQGEIRHPDCQQRLRLGYEKLDDNMLVYVLNN